jgi:tRNA pseudouridine38-40 synthase
MRAPRCRPVADEPVLRAALKIAYDGTQFWGTNPQPEKRTVYSEIRHALHADRVALARPGIPFASRTDRGVSALGNCIVLDVLGSKGLDQFVPSLNAELRDMAVVAAVEAPATFQPRRASMRVYRYALLCAEELDESPLREAAQLFVGKHNFQAFARRDKKRHGRPHAYESTIESIIVDRHGPVVLITVRGSRFWWNQIRRMVPAMEAYARSQCTLADLRHMLEGGAPVKAALKAAPPEPLILLDVEYPSLAFLRKPQWLRPKEGWLRRLTVEAAAAQAFSGALVDLLGRS